MASRVGVDVGGTFTDLLYYDDATGEVVVAKEPTTPASPDIGVSAALAAGVSGDAMSTMSYFLHGTTVGLNSLLTRTGAVVGLLVTRGFRDALEIRRGDRGDPYDLFWEPPEPLVPRRRRLPVTERVLASGDVHVELEESDVRAALEAFRQEGVEAIAVALFNSYANGVHELAAREILRAAGFDGAISLSHEISGEYREYERTSTCVIDAYVRPRMEQYLGRLGDGLARAGFDGQRLVTRCGGGSMTFEEARERPFETIMSGPVGGAEGAGELARALGLDDVVTADVGGTSFDTCLIADGRPQLMYEGRIVDMPVQTPWIDVRSIGAGGGSIAYVDVGGLLRVGPRSAGADPGPASYGRGATEPAVTDAALVLGMLGPGRLASGLVLDVERARAALAPLGERLGLEVDEVARGVMTIVAANMADAIREITVEQGRDPRRAAIMPFGGAGPLFGTLLARELEIASIVVPPYAGNFSAWGLLGADLARSAARTQILPVDEAALATASDALAELHASLDARQRQQDGTPPVREAGLDMRYVGQEYSLTVACGIDGVITETPEEIRRHFELEYERAFGHAMDEEIQIVSIRASMRTALPRRREAPAPAPESAAGPVASAPAYSFARGAWMDFPVIERAAIGERGITGPAILLEETATTYLDAGYSARRGRAGALLITDDDREPEA